MVSRSKMELATMYANKAHGTTGCDGVLEQIDDLNIFKCKKCGKFYRVVVCMGMAGATLEEDELSEKAIPLEKVRPV